MTRELRPRDVTRLETAAREAAENSYAPYSRYPVGAAVLAGSGRIFSGCNVENASYGLSNCAERTAIFKAASEGEREILAVAIYVPKDKVAAPCGAYRQVIREFGAEAAIIGFCRGRDRLETTLADLLPGSFGPDNLGEKRPPDRRHDG